MAPRTAKRKSEPETYTSDNGFAATTGSDDDNASDRPPKRTKTTTTATSSSKTNPPTRTTDSDGNRYWELSKMRRVTISEFKGKKMVNVREYYEKDGKDLPGKKGISLTLEQYSVFIDVLPQIEDALKKQGVDVPRPVYGGETGGGGEGEERLEEESDGPHEKEVEEEEEAKPTRKNKNGKKSNIEATSDEDED